MRGGKQSPTSQADKTALLPRPSPPPWRAAGGRSSTGWQPGLHPDAWRHSLLRSRPVESRDRCCAPILSRMFPEVH